LIMRHAYDEYLVLLVKSGMIQTEKCKFHKTKRMAIKRRKDNKTQRKKSKKGVKKRKKNSEKIAMKRMN
jgi:hypothetical protein